MTAVQYLSPALVDPNRVRVQPAKNKLTFENLRFGSPKQQNAF